MSRNVLIAVALSLALCTCVSSGAVAGLFGPGPWFGRTWAYGNDTGGIIPYSPAVEGLYHQMAADYCWQWGRLSHVTSVHRKYGDYISFVCMDRPRVIH
jgi:hypothetical protein